MAMSQIYLGTDDAHEQQVKAAVGVDIGRLHILAQRAAWGILMGERTGVDLDQVAERVLAEFGEQFAAHVVVAFIRGSQNQGDAAREHLVRARALVTPDHPWAAIVPSDARWCSQPAEQTIDEVEPGRVYRVASENRTTGKPLGAIGVATFLRVRSGALVCINPVQIDERVAARLRELGDVTHVIAPAKYHSDYVPLAQHLFPKARSYGVPAHRDYPQVEHIRFDGYLDDAAPLFPGEIDQITMHGIDVGDVWLIDRASQTLLVTDAVMLTRRTPATEAFLTPFAEFYLWAWGISDRIGAPSYQPPTWQNLPAYQASLMRAFEHEFAHVGSNHTGWHVIEQDGRAELQRSLHWLLDLSRLEGLGYVVNFVRRHPGIFWRLVREQLQRKRK